MDKQETNNVLEFIRDKTIRELVREGFDFDRLSRETTVGRVQVGPSV